MDMELFGVLRRGAMMTLTPYDSMKLSQKKYDQLLEPVCRDYGLTRSELDVMLFLHNNPDFDRASHIVSMRGMTKSHVSLSVTNLEAKGLLERHFEPADRRVAHLKLTEAAAPILQRGQEAQERFFSQLFAGLTPEQLRIWMDAMQKVNDNILSLETT